MESVLNPSEIEFYIDTIRPWGLRELGGGSWLEWHQRLQKLNQEAVVEAACVREEQVKETLVAYDKTRVLVHEAILVSVWKQKVLPILLMLNPRPASTFVSYSILYHEAVAVSLLELVMFHPSGCESLGDATLDLLDYSYDNCTQLIVLDVGDAEETESGVKEVNRQKDSLAFDIAVRCLSIIRYLSENMTNKSRMYTTLDVPTLFIELLIRHPWQTSSKFYHNSKWHKGSPEALTQAETQIWLTLRQLLLDPSCRTYYEITNARRNQFKKLLPLLTPVLLDQIAPLMELNQWLHHISISDQPSDAHRPVLLEAVPEIKNSILREGTKRWKKIAREQLDVIFCSDTEKLYEAAQTLAEAYNTDLLEKFETASTNLCSLCGKSAIQRCSKCKNVWYCSRKCQVDDWQEHKNRCN